MVRNKAAFHGVRHQRPTQASITARVSDSSRSSRFVHNLPPQPLQPVVNDVAETVTVSAGSFLVCGKPINEGIRVYTWITAATVLLGFLCSGFLIHHLNTPPRHTAGAGDNKNESVFVIMFVSCTVWFTLSVVLIFTGVLNEDRRLCITWIAAMAILIVVWVGFLLELVIDSTIETVPASAAVICIVYHVHGIWVVIHFIQWINEKKRIPVTQISERPSFASLTRYHQQHLKPPHSKLGSISSNPSASKISSKPSSRNPSLQGTQHNRSHGRPRASDGYRMVLNV
ncbi:hypothetical protein Ocin01_06037 [Orchesella cincta]|uniref:Uncharacterized protein n=1 Tax=Orchesella cincta TaxID=48709 RepID=A0A1D2N5T7_ORCCI|nr:hypothetical protein Ocin01_06037 [Orchesella cincta]